MNNEIPLAELPGWPEDLEGILQVEWPEDPDSIFKVEWPDWPLDAGPLPRELRSPHTAAYNVLLKLDAWGVSEWGFQMHELIAEIFLPLWKKNAEPDDQIDQLLELCEAGKDPGELVVDIVAAMCARAFRTQSNGEIDIAWSYAVDAESWLGTLFMGTVGLDVRRRMAKKGSDATHVANRADKERVFAWCDENMNRFTSMDAAAFDIAETFVPQKFRAVRKWMTDWNRLRSTGTE